MITANDRREHAGTGDTLQVLLQDHFDDWLNFSPEGATELGLDNADVRGRLDDRSAARLEQFIGLQRRFVDTLRGIPAASLNMEERRTREAVLFNLELGLQAAAAFPFGAFGGNAPFYLNQFSGLQPYVISHLDGAHLSLPDFLINKQPLNTSDDAEHYVSRIEGIGAAINQEMDRARSDLLDHGISPPLHLVQGALAQVDAMLAEQPGDNGVIGRLRNASPNDNIMRQAKTAWQLSLLPQLNALRSLLSEQLPHAPAQAGLCHLPDGREYYELALRLNTSTDLGAEEIHDLGISQVAELTARADTALGKVGLMQETVATRLAALANDPANTFPDTEHGKKEVLRTFEHLYETAYAILPNVFGVLPVRALTIQKVPAALEPHAPRGYYHRAALDGGRPASYFANLRTTAEWSRFYLPTFAFHEGVPGHHLQYDIELRHADRNPLSRVLQFQGYSEGWAVYAEQLMQELGYYQADPVAEIGYLQSMLLRAARLVVDTGLHHFGWSRSQAVSYLVDTVGETESRSRSEVDRYCVWPGQATSYMVGRIEWLRLRKLFETTGNPDLKSFHDRVLPVGAMPFKTMEERLLYGSDENICNALS